MNEMHIDPTTLSGIVGAILFVGLVVVCTVKRWIKMLLLGHGPEEPGWDPGTGVEL